MSESREGMRFILIQQSAAYPHRRRLVTQIRLIVASCDRVFLRRRELNDRSRMNS